MTPDYAGIPIFPSFRGISIADRDRLTDLTAGFPPYSDFDFGNMWSWDCSGQMAVSMLNGNLVVRFTDYLSGEPFLSFLGTRDVDATAHTLLAFSFSTGTVPELKLIPETVASRLDPDMFAAVQDGSNHDYVLSLEKVARYDGPKLAAMRRAVSIFERSRYPISFGTVDLNDDATRRAIVALFDQWQSRKLSMADDSDAAHERVALCRCIDLAPELNLRAWGMHAGETLAAFWIVGLLRNGYSMSHFEKADTPGFRGIFPYLKARVAAELLALGVRYINLEQDLGISGLRRSKASYDPAFLLRKYKVRFRSLS